MLPHVIAYSRGTNKNALRLRRLERSIYFSIRV